MCCGVYRDILKMPVLFQSASACDLPRNEREVRNRSFLVRGPLFMVLVPWQPFAFQLSIDSTSTYCVDVHADAQIALATRTMSSSGTIRGTPKGRTQIPSMPSYQSSSSIPRPSNLDGAPGTPTPSDAGASTLSSNRQKQLKRDEVESSCRSSHKPA